MKMGSTQMRPLDKKEMHEIRKWFDEAQKNVTFAKLTHPGIKLGKNFTFDEYIQIVMANREHVYWFGPRVEVPLIIVYVIIMVFGLLANGLICYVVVRRKKLRTVRNMFIMNLSISDIIMCLLCMPFTLVKLLMKNWVLGDPMCRLVPCLQAVNVFASAITITAIAVDRFQVILYPANVKERTKKWVALAIIALIWLASTFVGVPLLLYSRVETLTYVDFVSYDMCLEEWPSVLSRSMYALVIMLLQFVVPIGILITIHWRICNFLKCRIIENPTTPMEMKRALKEANRHRRNSTLLMAIAVMYAMCWFPLTLLNLMADFNYSIFMYKNFLLAYAVAHIVAMTSACLNPIIYGWFNTNFRREVSRIACFWREHPYDVEKKKLMMPPRARVVYLKQVSYKAIQTEVQPIYHTGRRASLPFNNASASIEDTT